MRSLRTRFCLECENFEDRAEIDEEVLCFQGHTPRTSCLDFQDRFEGKRKTESKTRFCLECENFEDRAEIDEILCAREHIPGTSCPDFQDRVTDSFYSYIFQAYLYGMGQSDAGRPVFEERFSRNLSTLELAYSCLVEYFQLGLDYINFHKCWKTSRKNYKEKLPVIPKIFDVASQRFETHSEKTNLERVFLDLLSSRKTLEEGIEEISEGLYRIGR